MVERARKGSAAAVVEDAFRLRHLGIGFVWAWIYGCYETDAVFPDRMGIGINADATWIVSATTVVAVLFVGGAVLGQRHLRRPGELGLIAGISAFLGTLTPLLAAPTAAVAVALQMASGIASGLGTGLLVLLWGGALAALEGDRAEVAIPASSLVMIVCALVLPYLSGWVGVVAVASLPLISGCLLLVTEKSERGQAVDRLVLAETLGIRDGIPKLSAILRLSAVLLLAYATLGCAGALQYSQDTMFAALGIDLPTIIGAASGFVLALCFVFFSVRTTFDGLFRWVAPLVVGSLALMPLDNMACNFLAEVMVAASDTLLQVGGFLFVIQLAHKYRVNVIACVGLCQGALQLGVLAGNLTGQSLAPYVTSSGAMAVAMLLLCGVFSLAWILFPTDRRRRPERFGVAGGIPAVAAPQPCAFAASGSQSVDAGDEGSQIEASSTGADSLPGGNPPEVRGAVPAGDAGAVVGQAPPSDHRLDAVCAQLAAQGALSARETEILQYLARGRSQPYIRDELVLSKNTVATHVKHIYQKLEVHSRQELLDLVERASRK